MDGLRIDKWLWAARFFKTRSLAADAVDSGRVRLDGERIKTSRAVKIGEVYLVDNGAEQWEVEVLALSGTRGPASVARTLYRETDDSIAKRALNAENRRLFPEPSLAIKGRPTKRDRRRLDEL